MINQKLWSFRAARGASLADFIQPSLGPLQPNLDDFMDTLEPLQEFLNSKLPSVPEEEDMFRQGGLNSSNYSELELMQPINSHNNTNNSTNQVGQMNESTVVSNQSTNQTNQQSQRDEQTRQRQQETADLQNLQYTAKIYTQPENPSIYRNNLWVFDKPKLIFNFYQKCLEVHSWVWETRLNVRRLVNSIWMKNVNRRSFAKTIKIASRPGLTDPEHTLQGQ